MRYSSDINSSMITPSVVSQHDSGAAPSKRAFSPDLIIMLGFLSYFTVLTLADRVYVSVREYLKVRGGFRRHCEEVGSEVRNMIYFLACVLRQHRAPCPFHPVVDSVIGNGTRALQRDNVDLPLFSNEGVAYWSDGSCDCVLTPGDSDDDSELEVDSSRERLNFTKAADGLTHFCRRERSVGVKC